MISLLVGRTERKWCATGRARPFLGLLPGGAPRPLRPVSPSDDRLTMWSQPPPRSTLSGVMTTSAEQTDFQSLFSHARRQVIAGPAGVREVRLALDGPPLRARSKLVTSG